MTREEKRLVKAIQAESDRTGFDTLAMSEWGGHLYLCNWRDCPPVNIDDFAPVTFADGVADLVKRSEERGYGWPPDTAQREARPKGLAELVAMDGKTGETADMV